MYNEKLCLIFLFFLSACNFSDPYKGANLFQTELIEISKLKKGERFFLNIPIDIRLEQKGYSFFITLQNKFIDCETPKALKRKEVEGTLSFLLSPIFSPEIQCYAKEDLDKKQIKVQIFFKLDEDKSKSDVLIEPSYDEDMREYLFVFDPKKEKLLIETSADRIYSIIYETGRNFFLKRTDLDNLFKQNDSLENAPSTLPIIPLSLDDLSRFEFYCRLGDRIVISSRINQVFIKGVKEKLTCGFKGFLKIKKPRMYQATQRLLVKEYTLEEYRLYYKNSSIKEGDYRLKRYKERLKEFFVSLNQNLKTTETQALVKSLSRVKPSYLATLLPQTFVEVINNRVNYWLRYYLYLDVAFFSDKKLLEYYQLNRHEHAGLLETNYVLAGKDLIKLENKLFINAFNSSESLNNYYEEFLEYKATTFENISDFVLSYKQKLADTLVDFKLPLMRSFTCYQPLTFKPMAKAKGKFLLSEYGFGDPLLGRRFRVKESKLTNFYTKTAINEEVYRDDLYLSDYDYLEESDIYDCAD